mmetsp:Transcript_18641/g.28184  ORF Transcript_18641/g.28184 Transcript_18641/m.28184 type:complete len:231 (-) Transcript_18641:1886-2578(-)
MPRMTGYHNIIVATLPNIPIINFNRFLDCFLPCITSPSLFRHLPIAIKIFVSIPVKQVLSIIFPPTLQLPYPVPIPFPNIAERYLWYNIYKNCNKILLLHHHRMKPGIFLGKLIVRNGRNCCTATMNCHPVKLVGMPIRWRYRLELAMWAVVSNGTFMVLALPKPCGVANIGSCIHVIKNQPLIQIRPLFFGWNIPINNSNSHMICRGNVLLIQEKLSTFLINGGMLLLI